MRPEPPARRKPPGRTPPRVRWAAAWLSGLLASAAAGGGCAIFNESVDVLTPGGYDETAAENPRLTRFRPVIEQISLEVISVERPADDPLLWRALWDPVGEVGAVDADRAAALREAGFRVGVIASKLPEALLTLTGDADRVGSPLPGTEDEFARVNRLPLRAGADAPLHAGPPRPEIVVTSPPVAGGSARTESFADASGIVRVRCRTQQEGWATFEFTPEIHHGPFAMRVAPNSTGWTSRSGQKVRSWPDRAFEITLAKDDSVILGLRDDADPGGLAAALLTSERDGHRTERLLVVTLKGLQKIQGERATR